MEYQQGERKIRVIVTKETDFESSGDRKTADEATGRTEAGNGNSDISPSRRKRFIVTNVTHTIAVAKQVGDLALSYELSGIGYRTGDKALQQRVTREVERIKDVTNFASSVAIGATYGAAGGVLGSAIGAALGAVSSGVSIAVKYAGREREYDVQIFKENNAIEYNRARASMDLTNGRLR